MHGERSRFANRILVLSCRDLATLTHVVQAQEWVYMHYNIYAPALSSQNMKMWVVMAFHMSRSQ